MLRRGDGNLRQASLQFQLLELALTKPKMFEFFHDNSDAKPAKTQNAAPGQVTFDERGNAIYAWREDLAAQEGSHAERLRERALLNPNLKLVNDRPVETTDSIRNDNGLQMGYNPYQSGQLAGAKPAAKKKPDMRELSKWIEMKRRLDAQKNAGSNK